MQIGTYDTDTWGVVSTYEVAPPTPVTRYVDVPGRMGAIDASTALTGYIVYELRTISVVLLVVDKSEAEYLTIWNDIYSKINGETLNAYLPNDSTHYWRGRWFVTEITTEMKRARTIALTCTAEPYAKKTSTTTVTASGSGSVTLTNTGKMPTPITLINEAEVEVTRGTTTTTYSAGTHVISSPPLITSETITVDGACSFAYQEGRL